MNLFGKIALCLTPLVFISTGWLLLAQSSPGKPDNSSNPSKSNNNLNSNSRVSPGNAGVAERWRIDNLTGRARGAPPEVAADALLTVVSSPAMHDKERSIALINEAFQIAGQAREPFKQRSWSLQVDTRSGFKQAASDLQLDRISLQSKAVVKMIPLDKVRAREMFEEISLPPIETRSCKDALVDDLDPYYETMAAIAETSFTDKERKTSMPIQFLTDRIGRIKSIPEIIPAEKLIVNAKTSKEELFLLTQSMTRVLNRVSDDPRSFAFAMERDVFAPTTAALISKIKQNNILANDFISAIRSFLTGKLSGEVCGDAPWIKNGAVSVPRGVNSINNLFTHPVSADEIHPAQIGSKAEDVTYWSTPKASALMEVAKTLRFGDGTVPLPAEQRETAEWHQKLLEFLDLIEHWDSDSESSEEDYFQEKCNMYNLLVELCPDDSQRDDVLRRYASYLKDASGRYKGRMEWILHVKEYLRVLGSKSEATQKASLDPWLSSTDISLQVYGELAMLKMSRN
jgi:hypothetical protein